MRINYTNRNYVKRNYRKNKQNLEESRCCKLGQIKDEKW